MKIKVFPHAVEFGETTFAKGREVVYPIDMDTTCSKTLGLFEVKMFVITNIDSPIMASPPISVQDAFGIHPPANDGLQGPR